MFPVKRIRGCHRQSNQREIEKIHQATYTSTAVSNGRDGNAGLSHILRCQRRLIQSANWGFTSQERRIIYYSSILFLQHYTGFTCIRVSFDVSNAKRTYHRSFAQYSCLSRITKASMKASHRQSIAIFVNCFLLPATIVGLTTV